MLSSDFEYLISEFRKDNFSVLEDLHPKYPWISSGLFLINEIELEVEDSSNIPNPSIRKLLEIYQLNKSKNIIEASNKYNELDPSQLHPLFQLQYYNLGFWLSLYKAEFHLIEDLIATFLEIVHQLEIPYYHYTYESMIANWYRIIGKTTKALDKFKQLFQKLNSYKNTRKRSVLNIVGILTDLGNYSEAIQYLDMIEKNAETFTLYGDIFTKEGHLKQGAEYLHSALNLEYNNKKREKNKIDDIKLLIVDCYIKQGKLGEAQHIIEGFETSDHPYKGFLIDNERVRILQKQGAYSEGLAITQKLKSLDIVQQNPYFSIDLLIKEADILSLTGNQDALNQILEDNSKLQELFSAKTNLTLWNKIFHIYFRQNNIDKLNEVIDNIDNIVSGLEDYPPSDYVDSQINRAKLIELNQSIESKIEFLDTLLQDYEDDFLNSIKISDELASSHLMLNNYSQAEKYYVENLRRVEGSNHQILLAETLYGLFKIFILQDELQSAKQAFEKIREMSHKKAPVSIQTLCHMANIHLLINDPLLSEKFQAFPLLKEVISENTFSTSDKITAHLYTILLLGEELQIISSRPVQILNLEKIEKQISELINFLKESNNFVMIEELMIIRGIVSYFLYSKDEGMQVLQDLSLSETTTPNTQSLLQHWRGQMKKEKVDLSAISGLFSELMTRFERLKLINVSTDDYHIYERVKESQRLELLGQVMASISHEFNNILAIILGYTQILSSRIEQGNTEENKLYLQSIESSTQKASTLISNIKKLTLDEQQKLDPMDLIDEVEEIIELVKVSFPPKIKIRYSTNVDHIPILANDFYLSQIIINLLINAKDAMSEGQVHINLSKRDRYAVLQVSDFGTGMSKETLDQIFLPFFTTKGKNGTGLGLYNVKKSVMALDAEIAVDSEPGTGTTFTVEIPLYRKEMEQVMIDRNVCVAVEKQYASTLIKYLELSTYRFRNIDHIFPETIIETAQEGTVIITEGPITPVRELQSQYDNIKVIFIIQSQHENQFDLVKDDKSNFVVLKKPFVLKTFQRALNQLFHAEQKR